MEQRVQSHLLLQNPMSDHSVTASVVADRDESCEAVAFLNVSVAFSLSTHSLQSKQAGPAISAFAGPHSLPLSPMSGPHSLPLSLQSAAWACNPRRQAHIHCH